MFTYLPSGPTVPFPKAGVRDFQQTVVDGNYSYETLPEILAGCAMGPRAFAASAGLALLGEWGLLF